MTTKIGIILNDQNAKSYTTTINYVNPDVIKPTDSNSFVILNAAVRSIVSLLTATYVDTDAIFTYSVDEEISD